MLVILNGIANNLRIKSEVSCTYLLHINVFTISLMHIMYETRPFGRLLRTVMYNTEDLKRIKEVIT